MENNSNDYDFSLLPPHVIAQVLSNLKVRQILNASQTCKSWYFASYDPMISKRIRVRIRTQYDRVDQLTRRFGMLVLCDTNFNEFNYKDFFTIFGQYIREIEFINCTLSAKQLADCLIDMTNLSIFKIVPRVETFAGVVTLIDSDIEAIKPILNGITYFSVLQHNSSCAGLRFIMSMMLNLKTLCFGPYAVDSYDPFRDLISYTNISNLENLEVDSLSQISTANFIRDFSGITPNLNLNSLAIRSVYSDLLRMRYYDENFVSFCKKLAKLKILSMQSIGEHQLADICQYMPQLIELNLVGITTNKIHVIENLKNLQKLSLKHFNKMVEEDQAGMFAQLENLKNLELDYEITDVVFNSICTNCKNLERLDLCRMKTYNLDVLYKNLVHLKYLDLSIGGPYIPFSVNHDITSLQLLEYLNVNFLVPGMSMALIEKLPNLRRSSLRALKNTLEAGVKPPPVRLII